MRALLLCLAVGLSACAKGGGSGSSSDSGVSGYDYSGTYISNKVECYNSSLTTLNTSAALSSGQETIIITGNSYASTISSAGCSVNSSGTIVFNSNGVNLSNRTVSSATGGGCTATFSVSNSPANTVSPSSVNTAYTSGQSLSNLSNLIYVRNTSTGATGLLTTFTNSASPSDYCVLVYTKQ